MPWVRYRIHGHEFIPSWKWVLTHFYPKGEALLSKHQNLGKALGHYSLGPRLTGIYFFVVDYLFPALKMP
jgi:hypothetical protein